MRDTSNPRAHRCYIEGEAAFVTHARKDLEKSRKCFEQARALDDTFARAWGYLAYTKAEMALAREPGAFDEALLREAKKDAEVAVQLDGADYANHWDLAFCHLYLRQYGQSMAAFEKAKDIFENDMQHIDAKPGLYAEMAEAWMYCGEHARAIEFAERALRIPDWYRWVLGMTYYCAGEYAKVLDTLEQMYRKPGDPRSPAGVDLLRAATHVRIAQRYAPGSEGRERAMAAAKAAMKRFRTASPRWSCVDEARRMPFRRARDRKHWLEALEAAGLPATSAEPKRRGRKKGPRGGAS